MKLNKLYLSLFAILCLSFAVNAQIEVEIIDGISNSTLKSTIENNASRFLTEVSNAYAQNRALNLPNFVTPQAEKSIEALWENLHFRPEDQYIGEILINDNKGYQIRNIPVQIQPQDAGTDADYKEAVLKFDARGNITEFYFAIDNNMYKQIMEKGIQLNDVERRFEILDYVERFRTSYNEKDLNFLTQVFSDDALIITGKVVTSQKMDGSISIPNVTYTRQKKQEYLDNLRRKFKYVRYINVNFDDVQIKRHGINPNIYGVRVIQHWNASNYNDEGYVFMLWDFTNPNAPQIHVRTWQPMWLDDAKTRQLPEDEIFDLNSIEGI